MMLKKVLALIVVLNFSFFAYADTTTNSFEILLQDAHIPTQSAATADPSGSSSGLSGGAIAGIVLGSTAGASGLLLGFFGIKKLKGTSCDSCVLRAVTLNQNHLQAMLVQIQAPYLKSILETLEVNENSKYIFIPDQEFLKGKNTVFYMDIPQNAQTIKILQAAQNPENISAKAHINGQVIEKSGKMPTGFDFGTLIINSKENLNAAYIVIFY